MAELAPLPVWDAPMSRLRLYSSMRLSVDERSLRPMNLSMAPSSRRLLSVNSCPASLRPEVCTTAATSFAPM